MRYAALIGALVIGLLFVAACRGVESTPTATTTQDLPGRPGDQVQQVPPPTATPSPKLPGSITPAPASESFRLDLGDGVVVAFVEGLSPKFSGKVAYVTHVPTGSQLVLDPEGEIIDRHDGRDDGPDRLDAVLADHATVDRIVEGLQADDDLRPREMSRAERKRTSGAEQNRTTERHVVKHQGPGGVRARFRQLPEVGWTSCCA